MAEKSKILIIGSTGYIGRHLTEASAKAGHLTFALVRESSAADSDKSKLIKGFESLGVTIVYGDIYSHESLVNAIKQVDAVISAVGGEQIADQVNIIAAIKEAGNNIKRFLPSEFGMDVDRAKPPEPALSMFAVKVKIRRAIEAEGIPHTYVASNGFAGYFLPNLGQLAGANVPPRDKITIMGDGNIKMVVNKEEDIATYTIQAVDDQRTLNKILYVKPPANILTVNEIVSIWERKIGQTIERTYILEDELLHKIQVSPSPINVYLALFYSTLVRGDATNFEIESSFGVEASELYPEVKYTTVAEYLDQFV